MGQERKKRISRAEWIHFFMVLIIFGTVSVFFLTDETLETERRSGLRQMHFSGVCQTEEEGEELPLNEDTLRKLGACPRLILTGYLDGPVSSNEQIFLYLRRINLKVYQNDALIYSYGKENLASPVLRSGGNVWVDFYTPGITGDDSIKIVLDNPYHANTKRIYSMFLNRIYVGDKMQLFTKMIGSDRFSALSSVVITLLGITLLIVIATMKAMGMKEVGPLLCFGYFMAVCGFWMMIDFDYISLISFHAVGWDVLETLLFVNMPVLGILYIRDYMATYAKKFITVFVCGLLLFEFSYIILQGTGILDGETAQEYFRYIVPAVLLGAVALILYELRFSSGKTKSVVFFSILLFIFFAGVGNLWYVFTGNYSVNIFNFGLCALILVQYGIVLRQTMLGYRKVKEAKRLERELMENKAVMMSSQIKPHFLFNSISCIRELCLTDPKKAHMALSQFSLFLRGNMDSLSSDSPIPFVKELSHVKNYLALEQLRFEERLAVSYDLETRDFLIPALTLQPIVENAVCYGISRKKEGGTLTISTREEKRWILITVSDDGAGFEEGQTENGQGDRSHIGISNVRERLLSQCGGTMEVKSALGEGTVVSMYIPKG